MTEQVWASPSGAVSAPRGLPLEQAVLERGPLPAANAAWVGAQIASALASLHAAGDVHGGIGLDTILMNEGNAVLGPGPGTGEREDDLRDLAMSLRRVTGECPAQPLTSLLEELLNQNPALRPTAAQAAERFLALLHPPSSPTRRRLLGLGAAGALTAALAPAAYLLLHEDDSAPHLPSAVPLGQISDNGSFLAFSPDGRTLAISSGGGKTRLWDVETRTQTGPPLPHPGDTTATAFSPDGRLLAVGDEQGRVHFWDPFNRTRLGASLDHDGTEVYTVAFSPDGRLLATGCEDTSVRLWNVEERTPVSEEPLYQNLPVSSMDFSPGGRLLATGGCGDGTLGQASLWSVDPYTLSGEPLQHPHWINSVKFSPDGRTLATSCYDGNAHLWEIFSRTRTATLPHPDAVHTLTYQPGGRLLATGCRNGEVRLWDTRNHTVIGRPLQQDGSAIFATAFSPDGRTLAVATRKGAVHLWRISPHNPTKHPN